jgi:predicted nucleotidyltransferase
MITKEDILTRAKLHPSRVHGITLFGSRVYGNNRGNSDIDVVVVANNSINSTEIRSGEYNIHIYTPDKFRADLDWHRPVNLEVLYAPKEFRIYESIQWNLKIDKKKLRHSINYTSNDSWNRGMIKIDGGDYFKGLKSIFHSIRIPIFAIQILNEGTIINWDSANGIWYDLIYNHRTPEQLEERFKTMREELLNQFNDVINS